MKTLALNMIAGPDTHEVMKRCLTSIDAKKNFDEVVIVVTTNQEEVMAEAKRWTDKVFKFEWTTERFPYGDFAGARNMALKNTTTDYIMWLDTDDVILPQSMINFKHMREVLSSETFSGVTIADINFFSCPYRLNGDAPDHPIKMLKRERVFKNCGAEWIHPVHEQLTFKKQGRFANFKNFIIDHHKSKTHVSSVARNLAILEHEVKLGSADMHIRLFYAQELLSISKADNNNEKREKAMSIMKDIVRKREGHKENLAFICIRIALEYAYGKSKAIYIDDKVHDDGKVNLKDIAIAETYARASQSFSKRYAEADVILGDIYLYKKMSEKAIEYYQAAIQKPLDSFDEQNVMFYEEIPSRRLAELFKLKGRPELALHFSTILLTHCQGEKELYKFREEVLKQIIENDKADYSKYVEGKKDDKDTTVPFRAE